MSASRSAKGWALASRPRPRSLTLNHSWREYGNRVGAWRCLALFERLGLPSGALVNTALYDHCPELIEAFVLRGDELIGHGHGNAECQGELSEDAETSLLLQCRQRIEQASRTAPRIAKVPIAFECMRRETMESDGRFVFFGRIVWLHACEGIVDRDRLRVHDQRFPPVGRFGAGGCVRLRERFAVRGRRSVSVEWRDAPIAIASARWHIPDRSPQFAARNSQFADRSFPKT